MTVNDPLWMMCGLYGPHGKLRYRVRITRPTRAPDVIVFGNITYVIERGGVRLEPAAHDVEYHQATVMHPSTATIVWDVHRNGTP